MFSLVVRSMCLHLKMFLVRDQQYVASIFSLEFFSICSSLFLFISFLLHTENFVFCVLSLFQRILLVFFTFLLPQIFAPLSTTVNQYLPQKSHCLNVMGISSLFSTSRQYFLRHLFISILNTDSEEVNRSRFFHLRRQEVDVDDTVK